MIIDELKKAIDMAKEILELEVKVPSAAINEIKNDAKIYLDNHSIPYKN